MPRFLAFLLALPASSAVFLPESITAPLNRFYGSKQAAALSEAFPLPPALIASPRRGLLQKESVRQVAWHLGRSFVDCAKEKCDGACGGLMYLEQEGSVVPVGKVQELLRKCRDSKDTMLVVSAVVPGHIGGSTICDGAHRSGFGLCIPAIPPTAAERKLYLTELLQVVHADGQPTSQFLQEEDIQFLTDSVTADMSYEEIRFLVWHASVEKGEKEGEPGLRMPHFRAAVERMQYKAGATVAVETASAAVTATAATSSPSASWTSLTSTLSAYLPDGGENGFQPAVWILLGVAVLTNLVAGYLRLRMNSHKESMINKSQAFKGLGKGAAKGPSGGMNPYAAAAMMSGKGGAAAAMFGGKGPSDATAANAGGGGTGEQTAASAGKGPGAMPGFPIPGLPGAGAGLGAKNLEELTKLYATMSEHMCAGAKEE